MTPRQFSLQKLLFIQLHIPLVIFYFKIALYIIVQSFIFLSSCPHKIGIKLYSNLTNAISKATMRNWGHFFETEALYNRMSLQHRAFIFYSRIYSVFYFDLLFMPIFRPFSGANHPMPESLRRDIMRRQNDGQYDREAMLFTKD